MDIQKRCTVCKELAKYFIKGTATAYCEEHAHEFFADTSYLASVEREARRLKAAIEQGGDIIDPDLQHVVDEDPRKNRLQ